MDRFASRDQVRRFILSRAVRRYAEAGPPGGYGTVEHNGKVYGTDPTLVDLIGRVAGDFDETHVSALADELLERGDARGEILAEWLGGNRGVRHSHRTHGPLGTEGLTRQVVEHRYPYTWGTPHAYTSVSFSRPADEGVSPEGGFQEPPTVKVSLDLTGRTPGGGYSKSKSLITDVPAATARQWLSRLGGDPAKRWMYREGGADAHDWMDLNYPSTKPPKPPDHHPDNADQFSRAVRKYAMRIEDASAGAQAVQEAIQEAIRHRARSPEDQAAYRDVQFHVSALADELENQDDPRAAIVRRNAEAYKDPYSNDSNPNSLVNLFGDEKFHAGAISDDEERPIVLPDGSRVSAVVHAHPDGRHAVTFGWHVPVVRMRDDGSRAAAHHEFSGHFTEEEGLEHARRISPELHARVVDGLALSRENMAKPLRQRQWIRFARHYAAYRAPAGGVVVPPVPGMSVGTFFKGGEMIPDLMKLSQGDRRKRLRETWHARKKKVKAVSGGSTDRVDLSGGNGTGSMPIVSYARVMRMARTNAEIAPFVKEMESAPGRWIWDIAIVSRTTSAQALQDFLDDVDDPRAELVRQTLHDPNKAWGEHWKDGIGRLSGGGHEFVARKDGSVSVGWWPSAQKIGHFGVVSSDHVRRIADTIEDENHRNNVHEFLDTHYGPRPTAPEAPEESEPEPPAQYAMLLRYAAVNHTDADFHARIAENTKERTGVAAYSDWLEEQGRPVLAEFLRNHLDPYTGVMNYWYTLSPEDQVPKQHNTVYLYRGIEMRVGRRTVPTVTISIKSPHPNGEPNQALSFNTDYIPPEHGREIVRRLLAEGYQPGNSSAARHAPPSESADPPITT
jgi:uncharacterized protein (TIGR02996 family)